MSAEPIHDVLNQSSPLEDYDSFASDRALCDAVEREGGGWAAQRLSDAGRKFAAADTYRLAALANAHRPVLRTHDRQGRRIDCVDFHPAWHELLALSIERGIVSLAWEGGRPGSQVARAALQFLYSQTECGSECPIAMSYAAVPVLRRFAAQVPDIADLWLPKLLSSRYDGRFIPARDKTGVLF
ncbi:MAG: DNA alkylation response protein, partial [Woeseiaceae bacterium]